MTEDGKWMPLIPPAALSVFNDYSRVILCCGARKSGKTMSAVCNRIMRHAWEVDGAVVGIIGKTVRNAGGGIWQDLVRFCMPGWVEAGIGMSVTQIEKITSDSHMRYIRVMNMHGSNSEIQLHSLDHDKDVEKKFKSMRFSMIVISEVDQFGQRSVLDILLDQLRMVGVPYEMHQLICDCNPPEEGKDHWLYDCLVNRHEGNKQLMPESAYHHFTLDDNPFLHPLELENLKTKYGYDPVKYQRFVEGRWVKDMTAGHFDQFFSFHVHVVGDTSSPNPAEHEVIVPPEGTTTLITGSDIGDVNHATTFMLARSTPSRDVVFDIFDEVVSIARPVSLREFAGMLMERILYWEKFMKDTYRSERVMWRHWADSSVMNYKAGADRSDAMTIYQASDNKIVMMSAKKGPGSIKQRINLVKRLLHGNRLYVSANCTNTVDWLRHLKKGKAANQPVNPDQDCRHCFDSGSYAIAQEIPIEMEMRELPQTAKAEEFVMV